MVYIVVVIAIATVIFIFVYKSWGPNLKQILKWLEVHFIVSYSKLTVEICRG